MPIILSQYNGLSFRFDKEILDKVKIKAEKENRSINNTVETILKQSLK